MHARLDTSLESWGGFSATPDGSLIYGRLSYTPDRGISVELAENPSGSLRLKEFAQGTFPSPAILYGQLVDGTRVTLSGCHVTAAAMQLGFGIGSPTTIFANQALFGAHVADLDQVRVKSYSVELSSLHNWTGSSPIEMQEDRDGGRLLGVQASWRFAGPIRVTLPERNFDVEIAHGFNCSRSSCSTTLAWSAALVVRANTDILFREANGAAWQCQSLMTLLVGRQLSIRSITIEATERDDAAKHLQLRVQQRGKHDQADVHPFEMLLPYEMIREEFSGAVRQWYNRSEQATLASNIFFGSQLLKESTVNVKFLAICQAAESYHRSLGSGVYMNQQTYDEVITKFISAIPSAITQDHRQSLKSRLRYGNEYSLRTRLMGLLKRLPPAVRRRIDGGSTSRFISKVADTRNFYTHYDHASQKNVWSGRSALVAAERLRVLVVANLLLDLGLPDSKLDSILGRSREFQHWLNEQLPP